MDLPNAKIFNSLNRGDANMMQSGGGGGVGVEEEAFEVIPG